MPYFFLYLCSINFAKGYNRPLYCDKRNQMEKSTLIREKLSKNIVANGLAKKCEIQLSYAIGVAKPVSVYVETFGTAKISEEEISTKICDKFDLTPRGIINYLDLQRPIYKSTTNYGHFGKENLPWEKIIKI